MQDQNEARAEARIRALKDRIARLGPMRPGLLTVQYKDPARRRGAYRQISYTFQRRSRSDYVRPDDLPRIRAELKNYARFKQLCERLVAESLGLSKLRSSASRNSATGRARPPPNPPMKSRLEGSGRKRDGRKRRCARARVGI